MKQCEPAQRKPSLAGRQGVEGRSETGTAGNGPRLAILLPCLIFGGAERVTLTLARALTAMGCRVTILLMSYQGELLEEARREFPVVDLHCERTKQLPGRLLAYLAANPTDVLLSSFLKLNLCACLVRMRHPRLRVLVWEHGHPSASPNVANIVYSASASLMYRLATKVICVSTGVARDVLAMTRGLGSRVQVISNPIPPPRGERASRTGGAKRIAWVGRLHEGKNPLLMVEAFHHIVARVDAELLFIGDGVMRAELEARCAQLGLSERVIFAGYQDDPSSLLAGCDVLALTSDHEGFGNVLVEAMYLGLGVVSTDSGGGVDDIIGDARYGSIVPRGDVRAIAQSIMAELANPRDPDQQQRGARRFLPETIAVQFLAAAGIDRP